MSPTLTTFLFEAANFLLLAAALGWLLFKPVRAALDAERQRHEQAQSEATAARAEAEALLAQARAAHEGLERELQEERKRALAEVGQRVAALEDAARVRRADEAREQEARNAAHSRGAMQELATQVGRVSAASVTRLLQTLPGPSLDLALVKAAVAQLDRIPAADRRGSMVESARALTPEAQALLEAALGERVQARPVAELGAGVRISTPAGQVDASASALARQAAQEVTAAITEGPAPGALDG